MLFDHLDLFQFSDFVLLLLFVLGVLCALDFRFPIVSGRQAFFTVLLLSGISPVFILVSYFSQLYTNPI